MVTLASSIRRMRPSLMLCLGCLLCSKHVTKFSERALQVVWPQSLEKVKLVVPSQSMQHAGWSLIQGMKNLPLTRSYGSIKALTKSINKSERGHGLVIASYMLGEIPSLKDRITIVCQLWDLSQDVLVSVEPGTPHGFNAISQM